MPKPTVLKFGGTSMADAYAWKRVLDIIATYQTPFVVVSATANTTRELLAAAKQALDDLPGALNRAKNIGHRHSHLIDNFIKNYSRTTSNEKAELWINKKITELKSYLIKINNRHELTDQLKDCTASIGEQLSSYLLAQCASVYGLSTSWIDAAEVIQTDSEYTRAEPDRAFINQKAPSLKKMLEEKIPIMGGYYGKDKKGAITTLGFEGSDYTASLMGAALSAEIIEIWTDVSGIFTCDPRVVGEAKPIPALSFQEATELAYFGAKVLHPSTTKPASSLNIPLRVKNIFAPGQPGTLISDQETTNGMAKALTFKRKCQVITVTSSHTVMSYEFLAEVFDILRYHHLTIEIVTMTGASVSIAIEPKNDSTKTIKQLRMHGSVEIKKDQGIISLVGCTKENPMAMIVEILKNVDQLSSAELLSFNKPKGNLNILVNNDHLIPAVKAIHKQIFN